MLSLALTLALAQPNPSAAPVTALPSNDLEVRRVIAVVLSSQRKGAESIALPIAEHLQRSLAEVFPQGVMTPSEAAKALRAAGVKDPRTCAAKPDCLARLAGLLGPGAIVVGVDVGRILDQVAVHAEARSAEGAEPLAMLDLTAAVNGWRLPLSAAGDAFSRELEAALRPAPPKETDLPTRADLALPGTPEPDGAARALQPSAPSARGSGRPLAWTFAGGAAVAAATAVTFGVLGQRDRSAYAQAGFTTADGAMGTSLSLAEAQALERSANGRATAALTGTIVAAVLAGTSGWLFTRE